MTWFKVDDTLAFHGKAVAAGNAAIGMWVRAGAWSAQTLTEGFVPDHMVPALGSAAQARALVAVGLWDRDDGGYRFHDWCRFQPSRESVEADRAASKERQRRARERARAARESREREADASRRDAAVTNGVTTLVVTVPPTRPDPTRPDHSPTESTKKRDSAAQKRGQRIPDGWEPPPDVIAAMRTERPGLDLRAEHLKFVDYWTAKPGKDGTKLDWPATWRNWMRNARTSSPVQPSRIVPAYESPPMRELPIGASGL